MGRRNGLTEAIIAVPNGRSLTYRQISDELNVQDDYVTPDGLFLAVEQIRECVRRHPKAFCVDRRVTPHLVNRIH